MSFSRRRQRASLLVAPLLLLAGCNVTYSILDRITGRAPARFALFGRDDMRAGERFAMLEHSATFESRVQFRCVELWPGARQCSVPIDPGTLIAIVDDRNRVARLTVVTANGLLYREASGEIEDAVKDMRDKWNAIRPANALPAGNRRVELRWQDGSGRSGASMWYAPNGTYGTTRWTDSINAVPDSMAVTDLRAYSELLASSPFKNKPSAQSAVAPTMAARPADSSARAGTQTPLTVASPPRIAPEDGVSAMHSDLRALSIAQEKYLRENGEYARKMDVLHVLLSTGVSVEFVPAGGDGWIAIASHEGVPGLSCVIYSGAVANIPRTRRAGLRAPSPGAISCDPS
jgi:hypothetical protein